MGHFVPINFDGSDLMEKILHAKAHPDQMILIIKNAKQHISKFLNFYSQENRAMDELKFHADHVHVTPYVEHPLVECDSRSNSTWLYRQLKNCNLSYY